MEVENRYNETYKIEDKISSGNELPNFLGNCIEKIAKAEGFRKHDVITKKISTDGGNYLAFLYEIDIKGETDDGHKEINLFVKNVVPLGNTVSEFFSLTGAYALECFAYTELSDVLRELQIEANVPLEDRFKTVKGYKESTTEAIILENVAKKGFKTLNDRESVVPLEYAELSIKELAKFHALGFIIQKKRPEFFEDKICSLKYAVTFNDKWEKFVHEWSDITSDNLSSISRSKVKIFKPYLIKEYPEYFTSTDCIRTLCHGDFRAGNILAKEENGKVTEVIPVDYQIINYGCPVNDILYFLYGCTDRKFRNQHMEYLLNTYYNTLRKFLAYFKINVAEVYPRKEFDRTIKAKEPIALMVALAFYPFFFASQDNIPDIACDLKQKVVYSPEIVDRVEEIIEDLDKLKLW